MNLLHLGWNSFLDEAYQEMKKEGLEPARVKQEHRGSYEVSSEQMTYMAALSGKFRFESDSREDLPAVGDWVLIAPQENQRAVIHYVLPRKSKFSRKAAGNTTEEQIIATNIDTVFLVNALNQDFNIGRIERYLVMAWESGANPVIVLSKADLAKSIEEKVEALEGIAIGVPIHVVSSATDTGINELTSYLSIGTTTALLGSSGAGKSTLINKLYGTDVQTVQDIREGDGKGRHTTTSRELIVLESGGVLIDTPGMRELQLWEASDMSHSFHDIESLAEGCHFRDCKHNGEPGCAVEEAIQVGELELRRFRNYQKFQRELSFLERQTNKKAQLEEKKKWKKLAGDRTRQNRR
ncbi:ribosome small subunit-dependent GTPase A [Guptibacillus hwajinpoensis]|uniref:Small ribosomal subunit biogenesis GTPase RsgA n=1 Tax=Guptibacillus hwajinpoensis TaxID=208199 RepID=A0A0J6CSH5_9BACL|nr:ribosome small subunit-dependent GTPase A [Alkalihalobacillus macyae]KMM36118.1 GTPase RsgA [Alkalihalobacillus macyae]